MGIKKGASAFWYSELGLHQLGSRPTVFIPRWTNTPLHSISSVCHPCAAAVLEATGATPDLNAGGPQGSTQRVPRFGGVNNGGAGVGNGGGGSQGTSSEDGEFFFSEGQQTATSHSGAGIDC